MCVILQSGNSSSSSFWLLYYVPDLRKIVLSLSYLYTRGYCLVTFTKIPFDLSIPISYLIGCYAPDLSLYKSEILITVQWFTGLSMRSKPLWALHHDTAIYTICFASLIDWNLLACIVFTNKGAEMKTTYYPNGALIIQSNSQFQLEIVGVIFWLNNKHNKFLVQTCITSVNQTSDINKFTEPVASSNILWGQINIAIIRHCVVGLSSFLLLYFIWYGISTVIKSECTSVRDLEITQLTSNSIFRCSNSKSKLFATFCQIDSYLSPYFINMVIVLLPQYPKNNPK